MRHESTLDKNGTYIFTPNHSSYLDIPLFALSYPGYYHFMAKEELARIPLFGIFFRTIDIAVNRESNISSYKALKKAEEDLDNNISLVMFPEGGVSMNAPEMISFKNGPFKLAIDKQVPIVPVTFLDNWWLFHDNGQMKGRPGLSRVTVHAPITTTGMTDDNLDELRNKVFEIINSALKE
ncbi:MAG: 1-acyl-sn-glycerol-3-phosphate acyltransferase, partial [Bacteroidetes bacterium]|nr:1-acyl-sn-glycerol-3-phosphate acyltransferase [Bacteroidota bacterium]